jgi:DNA-binding FadR family transcriptional regulator
MNTGIVDKRFTEREIAESLKQYIDSNNLPPGTPLATTAKLSIVQSDALSNRD